MVQVRLNLGVDRDVLRRIVLMLGRAILEDKVWPAIPREAASLAQQQGLFLRATFTPHANFRIAHLQPEQDQRWWRVTLVESNPAKVTAAQDKVMVYLEVPAGHRIRTGQVRRHRREQETVYHLVWFEDVAVPGRVGV